MPSGALSSGVARITGNNSAFAALKTGGSVVTWGAADQGGDSTLANGTTTAAPAGALASGVDHIASPFWNSYAAPSSGQSDATPSAPAAPPTSPTATTNPAAFSPAPGITVGETRGEAILAAAVPAAGADLLRGANIWVRPTSRVEYVASALPAGLALVKGKLVAKKPGTYRVKIKVKRANGTTKMRTITVKVR